MRSNVAAQKGQCYGVSLNWDRSRVPVNVPVPVPDGP